MDLDTLLDQDYDFYESLDSSEDKALFELVNKEVVENLHTNDLYDTSLLKIGQKVRYRLGDRGIGTVKEFDNYSCVAVTWDNHPESWCYPNQLRRA